MGCYHSTPDAALNSDARPATPVISPVLPHDGTAESAVQPALQGSDVQLSSSSSEITLAIEICSPRNSKVCMNSQREPRHSETSILPVLPSDVEPSCHNKSQSEPPPGPMSPPVNYSLAPVEHSVAPVDNSVAHSVAVVGGPVDHSVGGGPVDNSVALADHSVHHSVEYSVDHSVAPVDNSVGLADHSVGLANDHSVDSVDHRVFFVRNTGDTQLGIGSTDSDVTDDHGACTFIKNDIITVPTPTQFQAKNVAVACENLQAVGEPLVDTADVHALLLAPAPLKPATPPPLEPVLPVAVGSTPLRLPPLPSQRWQHTISLIPSPSPHTRDAAPRFTPDYPLGSTGIPRSAAILRSPPYSVGRDSDLLRSAMEAACYAETDACIEDAAATLRSESTGGSSSKASNNDDLESENGEG